MTSVGHAPKGPWVFDGSVAEVFDDMLPRSIPGHADMRRVMSEVLAVSLATVSGPRVLDVGCSLALTARTLAPAIAGVRVHGVDNSPAMIDAAQGIVPDGSSAMLWDVDAQGLPPGAWDAVVWCLTLQFIPVERRPALLAQTRTALAPGGVAFVVEKVQGEDPWFHDVLVDAYHGRKQANGYSPESVAEKARSLRYVMATLPESANVAMFRAAGFRVQPVWRSLNFAAWLLRPSALEG